MRYLHRVLEELVRFCGCGSTVRHVPLQLGKLVHMQTKGVRHCCACTVQRLCRRVLCGRAAFRPPAGSREFTVRSVQPWAGPSKALLNSNARKPGLGVLIHDAMHHTSRPPMAATAPQRRLGVGGIWFVQIALPGLELPVACIEMRQQ